MKTEFTQIRDLTDEEWLKLPKEEILQLYKNCYKLLKDSLYQPVELKRDWIDVKNNLPVVGDDCWSDQVILNVVHNGIAHITTGRMYNGEWYYNENSKKVSKDFIITHWMPLPKPINES